MKPKHESAVHSVTSSTELIKRSKMGTFFGGFFGDIDDEGFEDPLASARPTAGRPAAGPRRVGGFSSLPSVDPGLPIDGREVLSSEKFMRTIRALHGAKAKEFMYLRINEYLKKTADLLDMTPEEFGVGYIEKAERAADLVNYPLMGTIYKSVGHEEVQDYISTLVALPGISADQDYADAASSLMRTCKAKGIVKENYPGYTDAWDQFFGEQFKPAFTTLPNLIKDEERRMLFDAMAGIVTGRTPSSLEEHEELIEQAHKHFDAGDLESLGDSLYELTARLIKTSPPAPPEEDEGDGDGDGDDDGKNPFSGLGKFMASLDPSKAPPKPKVGAKEKFEAPDVDFDPDKLEELSKLDAEINIPEAGDGLAYVTFKMAAAPDAPAMWETMKSTYQSELKDIMRIVEEYYRVKATVEKGLVSGRPDGGRLHRLNFGARDVFKRTVIDSVGHLKCVVLLDESGSMGCGMDLAKIAPNFKGSGRSGRGDIAGGVLAHNGKDRSTVARTMAFLMTEVSRQLPGFEVETAGYTAIHAGMAPKPLQEVYQAVGKFYEDLGEHYHARDVPTIRYMGNRDNPYPLLSSTALSENSDLQALDWAIDRLAKENSEQKAIVYLADGYIDDRKNYVDKLIRKADRLGIYIYFMNLSGSQVSKSSPLSKLDQWQVDNFVDMKHAMKDFLNRMVAQLQ